MDASSPDLINRPRRDFRILAGHPFDGNTFERNSMNTSSGVSPKNDDERLLSTSEAADFLGLKTSTLNAWRSRGHRHNARLPWRRLGGRVRYTLGDLREFVASAKVGGEAA